MENKTLSSTQSQPKVLSALIHLLPYYRRHYFASLFLLIVLLSDAAAIITLSLTYKILFSYIATPNAREIINIILVELAIVFGIIFVSLVLVDQLIVYLNTKIMNRIRQELFTQLYQLDYRILSNSDTGELLNYFTIDLVFIERCLTVNLPGIIRRGLVIVLILSLLFVVKWELGLLALLIIPVMLGIVKYFNKKAMQANFNKKKFEVDILNLAKENIELNSFMRTYNLISYNTKKYNNITQKLILFSEKHNRNSLHVTTSIKISFFVTLLAAIAYSITLVLNNDLSLGGFMAVITLYSALISAIFEVIQHLVEVGNASISMDRITHFLNKLPKINYDHGIIYHHLSEQITFENIYFEYRNNHTVLENISFAIPTNTSLGIAGYSGSGKSTLLSLILNLYKPTKGRILIDGVDLKNINPTSYYNAIAVINQDPPLINGTIFDNIRIGGMRCHEEAVFQAAKEVGLHDFIVSLPDGYQTKVGTIASKLSGGQKQRIAIARALVRNAEILILDEVTTGLDPLNQKQILHLLESFYGKKTIIHISHKLAALEKMDNIIVIDKGKLIQSGTHKYLVEQEGLYKKLWDIGNAFDIHPENNHIEVKTYYLSQIPLFSNLSLERLNELSALFSIYKTDAGTIITKEGDIGDKLYIIVSGLLSVFKNNKGEMKEISILQDGDYFGEISLVKNIPRTATVITKSPAILLTLNQEQFLSLIINEKSILDKISKDIEKRF